jgi:CRISPR-associated endonuclease/helicase Cas3
MAACSRIRRADRAPVTSVEPAYFRYWGKAKPGSDPPYHLLPLHCLDVAAVGHVYLRDCSRLLAFFARNLVVPERAVLDWLTFLLALHDLGKFAITFQGQRPDLLQLLQGRYVRRPYTIRHDTLGSALLRRLARDRVDPPGLAVSSTPTSEILLPWFDAVAGHHGQPPLTMLDTLAAHFIDDDIAAARAFVSDARRMLLGTQSPEQALALNTDQHPAELRILSWWLAGLTVLADWLGSNTDYFGYCTGARTLESYWHEALEKARRALDRSGVLPQKPARGHTLRGLFSIAKPTALQQWAQAVELARGSQLYILEDVAGAGKTEAALTLAYRLIAAGVADGVYVALPTMATANAMFDRVRAVASRMFDPGASPSCVLAHGQRHLVPSFRDIVVPAGARESDSRQSDETASARCTAWLADHNKKALLATVGVGTVDQALLAVLRARHQSLRLLGLFGKVLIVDEVHACDAYMQELLERLLEFQAAAGGHAILLSASLTLGIKRRLATAFARGASWPAPRLSASAYPLATRVHAAFPANGDECHVETRPSLRRRVRVEYLSNEEEVLGLIRGLVAAGRCVCWIRNTVADAIAAWERLARDFRDERCILYHARFALGDRLAVEERVYRAFGPASDAGSRRGKIVVATQVVEQSLDVDFDSVVTDLCPMDRLIQRAGRMLRHTRNSAGNRIAGFDGRGDPVLHVFGPPWLDNPRPDWFSAIFPGAAIVYPHHGQLWLTAKLVREGEFRVPGDVRRLIEGVFGEDAEYPRGLQRTADRVEGQQRAQTNFAASEALRLESGYAAADRDWRPDDESPLMGAIDEWDAPVDTRAGEPTTIVRLALRQFGRIVPLCGEGDDPWELSSLRVAKRLIAQTAADARDPALAATLDEMPDKGRWSVLLVLVPEEGGWRGEALDARGQTRAWRYDRRQGLRAAD